MQFPALTSCSSRCKALRHEFVAEKVAIIPDANDFDPLLRQELGSRTSADVVASAYMSVYLYLLLTRAIASPSPLPLPLALPGAFLFLLRRFLALSPFRGLALSCSSSPASQARTRTKPDHSRSRCGKSATLRSRWRICASLDVRHVWARWKLRWTLCQVQHGIDDLLKKLIIKNGGSSCCIRILAIGKHDADRHLPQS